MSFVNRISTADHLIYVRLKSTINVLAFDTRRRILVLPYIRRHNRSYVQRILPEECLLVDCLQLGCSSYILHYASGLKWRKNTAILGLAQSHQHHRISSLGMRVALHRSMGLLRIERNTSGYTPVHLRRSQISEIWYKALFLDVLHNQSTNPFVFWGSFH